MNWSYLFKHWFGTLALAPLISEIIKFLFVENSNMIGGLLEVYPLTIIFGFIFSIPTYIGYSIVYYWFGRKNVSVKISKLVLIILSFIGIIVSFAITFNNRQPEITIAYIIASLLAGLFFKLNFKFNDHNQPHH